MIRMRIKGTQGLQGVTSEQQQISLGTSGRQKMAAFLAKENLKGLF